MIQFHYQIPTDAKIKAFVERKRKLAYRALEAAARAAQEAGERALLDGPASGRIYRSRRSAGHRAPRAAYPNAFGRMFETGEEHQASAEGESPHEDTGSARQALTVYLGGNNGSQPFTATGWEGLIAKRMASLEYGSASGKRGPRPIIGKMKRAGIEAMRATIRGGAVDAYSSLRMDAQSGYATSDFQMMGESSVSAWR